MLWVLWKSQILWNISAAQTVRAVPLPDFPHSAPVRSGRSFPGRWSHGDCGIWNLCTIAGVRCGL